MLRILDVEHAVRGESEAHFRNVELDGCVPRENLARSLGRLQRRVAAHQGDAARVAAQINRREIGVGRHDLHVSHLHAENLGHDVGEDRIGSLPDVRGAAEHRDAAAAIELELHTRVRHVVPVDRETGSAEVAGARETDALARREPAEPLPPARSRRHATDALAQPNGADPQVVGGHRVRRHEVIEPEIRRVDADVLRELVEVDFECVARLRRAVAALGAAWRLVREHARALELVALHMIRDGLKGSGVVRAGHSVRAVGAAVEQRLEVHSLDRAVP